LIYRKYS